MEDKQGIVRGEGLPVVILPGISVSAHATDEIVSKLLKEYKTITLNIPGQGGADPVDKKHRNASGLADYFIDLLDGLGIEDFALVGISLGGTCAIEMASKYPKRVRALVLQETPYKGRELPAAQRITFFGLYSIASVLNKTRAKVLIAKTTEWCMENIGKAYIRYKGGVSDRNEMWKNFDALSQAHRNVLDRESYLDYIYFILKQDLTAKAHSIAKEIKVLLIDGENSESSLVKTSDQLAKLIPGAENPILIPGQGHLLPWLRPDIFVEEIKHFFLRCNYV